MKQFGKVMGFPFNPPIITNLYVDTDLSVKKGTTSVVLLIYASPREDNEMIYVINICRVWLMC